MREWETSPLRLSLKLNGCVCPAGFPPPSRTELGFHRPDLHLVLHVPLQFSIANKSISDEIRVHEGGHGHDPLVKFVAYGCGQIINGLLTDRLGGKRAMLIGAAGTVTMSMLFGVASFWGMLWLFALLRGLMVTCRRSARPAW